jgi:putative tryptophan/tyrosine transport system substrate-binding protein
MLRRADSVCTLPWAQLICTMKKVPRTRNAKPRKYWLSIEGQKKLLSICGYREHVQAGGLVSCGIDLLWCFHRAAYYVDKILKGARPADLRVKFPTKILLFINTKTVRALGLTRHLFLRRASSAKHRPPSLLVRADEVIE